MATGSAMAASHKCVARRCLNTTAMAIFSLNLHKIRQHYRKLTGVTHSSCRIQNSMLHTQMLCLNQGMNSRTDSQQDSNWHTSMLAPAYDSGSSCLTCWHFTHVSLWCTKTWNKFFMITQDALVTVGKNADGAQIRHLVVLRLT